METQLYEKVHEVWKDKPDKSTPCMGADLMHFEDGIYNNSANIKALAESGFITKTVDDLTNYYKKSETYTKEEVAALIAGINTMQFSVVTELPTEDISTSTIYLVPAEDGNTGNIYNEYLYVNGSWEVIGNTAIDLSGYLTKTGDSGETVSSGTLGFNEYVDLLQDADGYPILNLDSTKKLRVKFATISYAFEQLVSTIKSKIKPLTTSLAVTEQSVSALDGTVGKVLNDKITVNSDAISQINSDLLKTAKAISGFLRTGSLTLSIGKYRECILFAGKNTYIIQGYSLTIEVLELVKNNDYISYTNNGDLTLTISLTKPNSSIYVSLFDVGSNNNDWTGKTISI